MKEKILITGATGFIGSNLTRRLVEEKKEVYIVLRKESDICRIKDIIKRVNVIYADLLDYDKLAKKVQKVNPKYIFHLATYGSYPDLQKDDNLMIKTNILGTYNLLKATKGIDYKCFIHTGSSSEYGIKDTAISETDILEPVDQYGVTKACATLLCQMFSKKYKKNIVILRPFSVFGPYEKGSRFIPYVIMGCLKKKEVKMTSGEQKRDFIFINDVIDIYLKVMDKEGISGQIFNVGTGNDSSIKETAKIIFELTGSDPRLLKIGAKKSREIEAITSWKADTSKMEEILGYKPQHTLREGIKKTMEWFMENMGLYTRE